MPVVHVNDLHGTFDHECTRCHEVRTLSLDPSAGDLVVYDECFTIGPCPTCLARYASYEWECLRRDIAAHEAGEGPHPGSLVGYVFPDTGNIVSEHLDGFSYDKRIVHACHLIRQMQRHPLLAKHAPLKDEGIAAPWPDGTEQFLPRHVQMLNADVAIRAQINAVHWPAETTGSKTSK